MLGEQDFYRALGPSGQENLKSIVGQDPAFLPALSAAMQGGADAEGGGQFSNLPSGLVNVVLVEANNDPAFRAKLVDALNTNPDAVMEVVGAEASADMSFGAKLGAESVSAALKGDLDFSTMMAAGGGLMNGLMSGLGGLMESLMGMLGELLGPLKDFFNGDVVMQSVGDALPGERPVDTVAAEHAGEVFTSTPDGGVETYDGSGGATVGTDTRMPGAEDPARTAGVTAPRVGG